MLSSSIIEGQTVKAAEVMGRWSWETWFAMLFLIVVLVIGFGVRWLVSKHEQLWTQWMKSQEEKEELWREVVVQSQQTNAMIASALDRQSATNERVEKALETVHFALREFGRK